MNQLSTALLIRDFANKFLLGLNKALFPRTKQILAELKKNPGNILILRSGNIGDTTCALPALAFLRDNFPQAHICLLTSPGPRGLPEAREVVEGLGLVDEIITFYQDELANPAFRLHLLKELRRRRFDLFVLLPQGRTDLARTLRDLAFARLVGVKGALGFALSHNFPGFDLRRLQEYVPPDNEVERLLKLLSQAGINGRRPFCLNLPVSCHHTAERLLAPFQLEGRPIIGLQVFSKVQAKQWPLENFSELAQRLQEAYKPLFILFGAPSELDRLLRLAESFPGEKLVAAGQVTVLETAALLARCTAIVTLDTGPMHLAALVGTPIVALFSARHSPKMWEPWTDKAVILRKSVPCELCFRDECWHSNCMRTISVTEVFQSVQSIFPRYKTNYN